MGNKKIPTTQFRQLKNLLEDADIAKEFGALKNLQEMHRYLLEKNIELTPEEIYYAAAAIASEKSDELSEDMLDEVSGGKTVTFWIFEFNFEKPKWWPW